MIDLPSAFLYLVYFFAAAVSLFILIIKHKPLPDFLLFTVSNKPAKFVTFFLIFVLSQIDIFLGLLAAIVFVKIDNDISEAAK